MNVVCVRCALHIQLVNAVRCSSSTCHQKYDKCEKIKEYLKIEDGQLRLSPQDHALERGHQSEHRVHVLSGWLQIQAQIISY